MLQYFSINICHPRPHTISSAIMVSSLVPPKVSRVDDIVMNRELTRSVIGGLAKGTSTNPTSCTSLSIPAKSPSNDARTASKIPMAGRVKNAWDHVTDLDNCRLLAARRMQRAWNESFPSTRNSPVDPHRKPSQGAFCSGISTSTWARTRERCVCDQKPLEPTRLMQRRLRQRQSPANV